MIKVSHALFVYMLKTRGNTGAEHHKRGKEMPHKLTEPQSIAAEVQEVFMAFTRKFLAAMGIEPEKIDEIIAAHAEVTEALKSQINDAKAETESIREEAGKVADVQAELDKVKKDLETANKTIETAKKDDFKGKYEAATAELEMIKSENAAKQTATIKQSALKDELKKANYTDNAISLIIRNGFANDVEIGEDGKATNLETVIKAIQADSDFSGFTPKTTNTSVKLETPPANVGGAKKALTWEDIDKITNTEERQNAIAANMESLGLK